jgi:hypothetical protein
VDDDGRDVAYLGRVGEQEVVGREETLVEQVMVLNARKGLCSPRAARDLGSGIRLQDEHMKVNLPSAQWQQANTLYGRDEVADGSLPRGPGDRCRKAYGRIIASQALVVRSYEVIPFVLRNGIPKGLPAFGVQEVGPVLRLSNVYCENTHWAKH